MKLTTKKLMLAVCALAVSVLVTAGAVFAWFAVSSAPRMDGMETEVVGLEADVDLKIVLHSHLEGTQAVTVYDSAQGGKVSLSGFTPGDWFSFALSVCPLERNADGSPRAKMLAVAWTDLVGELLAAKDAAAGVTQDVSLLDLLHLQRETAAGTLSDGVFFSGPLVNPHLSQTTMQVRRGEKTETVSAVVNESLKLGGYLLAELPQETRDDGSVWYRLNFRVTFEPTTNAELKDYVKAAVAAGKLPVTGLQTRVVRIAKLQFLLTEE